MANISTSLLIILSCLLSFSSLSSTTAENTIDSCRRLNPNWSSNRQALANCAVGFGSDVLGGKTGHIYIVTDPSDDPNRPKTGTLRYGATREEPLWIVFEKDMVLAFKSELLVKSYKTIDGRGVKVEITDGPCIGIHNVEHVIIHSLSIHDCKKGKSFGVLAPNYDRQGYDEDGISISASSNVWIDHCHFANCADGLIDVTHASTKITISNNHFTRHTKVMLLGHKDGYTADKIMQVTLAFNHFGPNLTSRLPRIRYGYVHVANNFYEPWNEYAIGGSSGPTILSEGNYFIASNDSERKQVTKREVKGGRKYWKDWRWTTHKDEFENGAYFVPSGAENGPPPYSESQMFIVANGSSVPSLTSQAGPLKCVAGQAC